MLIQLLTAILPPPDIQLKIFYTFLAIVSYLFISLHIEEQKHQAKPPRGFKKLGRNGVSNLADEQDAIYSSGVESGIDEHGRPNWRIKALYLFPVKSCAPLEVDVADTSPIGLVWDREFSFAELVPAEGKEDGKPSWRFRTQRTPGYENLALVVPELWFPEGKTEGTLPTEESGGVMIIRYPRVYRGRFQEIMKGLQDFGIIPKYRSFSVPLDPPKPDEYPSNDVIIWKDTPHWYDYSRYIPSDFPSFVKDNDNPFALFRADPSRYREVFRCAPRAEELGYQSVVGFQDAYPLHLLNLSSVRDVADKVKQHLPNFSARRFRANIITTGFKAYDEDDWKRIAVGNDQQKEEYYCACHTVRCKLPNVDPDTAVRHRFEPDRTLRSFRNIDAGDPGNACLGMQLVPAQPKGTIRVGDEVTVLERGEHLYIKQ